jgi:predicted Fe-S protein YdhL (DUF1289 family)
MSQPEREKFLGDRSSEQRKIILLKLEEYQGLPDEQREERLRELQVRVWVRRLIKLPLSNRVERLVALQPAERQLVETRLAKWDGLSEDTQKEVLTSEIAIGHIANSPDFKVNPAMPPFPPDAKVASELKRWGELSEARRREILGHFEEFFQEVTPQQRANIIAQRPTVAPIATLTKEQRERYVAGLKRFDALTPAERQRFLINVTHWQKMTPEQRQSWRVLVKKLSPSAPPPPPPSRPSAAVTPAVDQAALDLPAR